MPRMGSCSRSRASRTTRRSEVRVKSRTNCSVPASKNGIVEYCLTRVLITQSRGSQLGHEKVCVPKAKKGTHLLGESRTGKKVASGERHHQHRLTRTGHAYGTYRYFTQSSSTISTYADGMLSSCSDGSSVSWPD